MNNLEILKNELINQKNLLESKKYTVNSTHTYPSPSEITNSLYSLVENDPDISKYSSYYKALLDPNSNTPVTNLIIPEGTISIRSNFAIDMGDKLTGIINFPSSLIEIGAYAFSNTAIDEVNFPEGLQTIGEYCFSDCVNLKKAIIPDSVTTLSKYSFQNCTELTEIKISENITELSASVFKILNQLTTLTIPENITKINVNNFNTIPLVENIYLRPNSATIASSSIFGTHNYNLKVWINFEAFPKYSTTTNLKNVKDHLISEVTISELVFPTSSASLKWFATIQDATNNTNVITSPSSVGTYYCKLNI